MKQNVPGTLINRDKCTFIYTRNFSLEIFLYKIFYSWIVNNRINIIYKLNMCVYISYKLNIILGASRSFVKVKRLLFSIWCHVDKNSFTVQIWYFLFIFTDRRCPDERPVRPFLCQRSASPGSAWWPKSPWCWPCHRGHCQTAQTSVGSLEQMIATSLNRSTK